MVAQHYRWDFIGLSTDEKPTPATSEKVVDGSTFYCSDTSKLYVFCKDNWYERKALGGGGGGGGPTVVQTTGTSTTDVMSQKSVTDELDLKVAKILTEDGEIGGDVEDQRPYIVTSDKDSIDAGQISNFENGGDGTIVAEVDSTTGKTTLYTAHIAIDPDTGDPTIEWTEVGGGGAAPTVVQTTGTSTTDVMSQNATTSMVFHDPDTRNNIQIGNGANNKGARSVVIGGSASSSSYNDCVVVGEASSANRASSSVFGMGSSSVSASGTALGYFSAVSANNLQSVALGSYATTSRSGEVNIGTGNYSYGYNSTAYRVLGGVHDGQDAHDAVTVGQVNSVIDAINTALSTNIPHIGS